MGVSKFCQIKVYPTLTMFVLLLWKFQVSNDFKVVFADTCADAVCLAVNRGPEKGKCLECFRLRVGFFLQTQGQ